MSQYVDTSCKAFEADAAITQYARVKLDSDGKITEAGASVLGVGVATREAFAAGEYIDVKLWNSQGTVKMIASEAITAGAPVYAAADGEVAADGDTQVGVAMEAATADQDIIEVMPLNGGGPPGGILNAAQQALSGAGAVNVTTYYTAWTTTSANAGTLADGTYPGQLKKVKLIVDGGDGTLTPTNFTNGSTITFADAGDYALLLWDGDSWTAVEVGNDADGATAPVIA